MTLPNPDFVEDTLVQTTTIVAAYVGQNSISTADLPALIGQVHATLQQLAQPAEISAPATVPAVPIKKSVTADHLVCLEDGKAFKSLKRHLSSHHQLTPDAYRAKWSLPGDYPMVAPNYAVKRSELAKSSGLGLKPAAKPKAKGRAKAAAR